MRHEIGGAFQGNAQLHAYVEQVNLYIETGNAVDVIRREAEEQFMVGTNFVLLVCKGLSPGTMSLKCNSVGGFDYPVLVEAENRHLE